VLDNDRCRLYRGDSADLLSVTHPGSVHAVVTDPPAGIGFMGKDWDKDKGGRDAWVAWLAGIMRGAFEALKPGGHALVWALPRTSHWTATALEDAGFEIRDVVVHLFGTGFPKSHDVAKAIAKGHAEQRHGADWQGWGTALKPASEHWILARKPLDGTVAANVLEHGTGGLNVDGCRIAYASEADRAAAIVPQPDFHSAKGLCTMLDAGRRNGEMFDPRGGRWPANVTLDEEAAAMLDEQSGTIKSRAGGVAGWQRGGYVGGAYEPIARTGYDDSGGASRFFYVAKVSRKERDAGVETVRDAGVETVRDAGGAQHTASVRLANNHHPTVKPTALMRWLCRLITPPGGTVLDMFAGSGSTGLAAIAEGFRFIGIEREAEYADIAKARLLHALSKENT